MKQDANNAGFGALQTLSVCLYEGTYRQLRLRLVSADLNHHLSFMHNCTNQHYAYKYWQVDKDINRFFEHYQAKLSLNEAVVMIAYIENTPVALIETAPVLDPLLTAYYKVGVHDMCFHLLMAPFRELIALSGSDIKSMVLAICQGVLEYLFYTVQLENVLALPDADNRTALEVAERSGFSFISEVALPEREGAAALYICKRDDFFQNHPKPNTTRNMNLFADSFR